MKLEGRDSEAGRSFPDPTSAFVERQKYHSEVDAGAAQKPLKGNSILLQRSRISVLEVKKGFQKARESFLANGKQDSYWSC